jgi:hypothetical protein
MDRAIKSPENESKDEYRRNSQVLKHVEGSCLRYQSSKYLLSSENILLSSEVALRLCCSPAISLGVTSIPASSKQICDDNKLDSLRAMLRQHSKTAVVKIRKVMTCRSWNMEVRG